MNRLKQGNAKINRPDRFGIFPRAGRCKRCRLTVVDQFDLKLPRVPGAEALRCPRTQGIWGVEDSAPGTQFQIDPLPDLQLLWWLGLATIRYRRVLVEEPVAVRVSRCSTCRIELERQNGTISETGRTQTGHEIRAPPQENGSSEGPPKNADAPRPQERQSLRRASELCSVVVGSLVAEATSPLRCLFGPVASATS